MGLCAAGEHLWLSDMTTRRLLQLGAANGRATGATLAAPGFLPTGLAWHQGVLYSAEHDCAIVVMANSDAQSGDHLIRLAYLGLEALEPISP